MVGKVLKANKTNKTALQMVTKMMLSYKASKIKKAKIGWLIDLRNVSLIISLYYYCFHFYNLNNIFILYIDKVNTS